MASLVVGIYAWSTIWNFFDLTQPQRPPTEKVLKFNMSFHDFVEISFFFKSSKESDISPQIIEFKNQEDSGVISSDFPGLKNLSSLIDLSGLCNLTGLNSL